MLPLDGAAVEPRAGGKAATLARARAAGFAVPDGIVALPGEPVDEAALAEALRRLGGERFAVRSSATLEDLPDRSAAGLFRSELEVPASEVAGAIARVRASAQSPSVRSYLGGHGEAGLEIAVLIQPMVEASLLGVLHLTDGGAAAEGDAVLVHEDVAQVAGGGGFGDEQDEEEAGVGEAEDRLVAERDGGGDGLVVVIDGAG